MEKQEIIDVFYKTQEKWINQGLLFFEDHFNKQKLENLDVKGFILEFLLTYRNEYDSYNVTSGRQETGRNRRRSIEDTFRLAKYYYPNTNIFEVTQILISSAIDRETGVSAVACPDIKKITFKSCSYSTAGWDKYSEKDRSTKDQSFTIHLDPYWINKYFLEDVFLNEDLNIKKQEKLKNMKKVVPVPVVKKGGHRISVRSRHPSHSILRVSLPKLPFKAVVRLGSTTELENTVEKGGRIVEINTTEAIKNSASKLNMKLCFTEGEVKTADWYVFKNNQILQKKIEQEVPVSIENLPFPLIGKSLLGSRGVGNTLLKDAAALKQWMQNRNLREYILEKYYTYSREYRLHVTADGCFYTCRKMLKRDTPEDKKFQRHDDNCVWILEDNPSFDKPVNWNDIVNDCVKALQSLGLDIAAFDVKVQSAKTSKGEQRKNPEWIIIESCSAPSFGNVTSERYTEIIPILATKKAQQFNLI